MSDFITLYTDASFNVGYGWARVAFKGRCKMGPISGSEEITATDIHEAEMMAIYIAIREADKRYPELTGFFINSDNKHCCEAFWTFRKGRITKIIVPIKEDILKLVGQRWIRTKHVKAHTNKNDIRSYMNREVDRMTRTGESKPKVKPLTQKLSLPKPLVKPKENS